MSDLMRGSSAPLSTQQQRPTGLETEHGAFHAHVELLSGFLAHRTVIVDSIERLLNCQKKPIEYQQDNPLLSQLFKDCFFEFAGLTPEQINLRDQLEFAHWASGFKPRANPGNDIIDPTQMLVRGLHFWRQTRWPGQKGRVRYAHTLFNVYVLRCLTLLNMRLWDADAKGAGERLAHAQSVLDELWRGSPADQPVLVRDVRWLIPVAMSPTTDELAGYFAVAEQIATTLSVDDQVEIQKAWVQTGAGHLRSQLHHLCVQQSVPLDEHSIVLVTRLSNALDVALLTEGLVTLLTAYERALLGEDEQEGDQQSGDKQGSNQPNSNEQQRLALAAAICQGISPDPALFLNRLDLLGPYTMIEHLFIAVDEAGHVGYTTQGQRHLRLLHEYQVLITRLATPLLADVQQCRPVAGCYAPYGALYGFSSNLLELMAFKTLQPEVVSPFSLEDVFTSGGADKLAWVNSWRNLPHVNPEVVKQFEYPREFVEDIYKRVEREFHKRVAEDAENPTVATGRLYLASVDDQHAEARLSPIPELPLHYMLSSDPQLVAAHKAEFKDQADLLYCRLEGEFIVSYQTTGGWVGLSKDILTEVLGKDGEAKLLGFPQQMIEALTLLCPGLLVG